VKEQEEEVIFNYAVFEETEDIFSSSANSQRLAILHIISQNQKI
jgi:hypothetical protein